MKKILALLLVLVTVLALTACGAKKADEKTFTVGFDAAFPPFGYVADDGSYDGFDLACAKEVCERLGWTFDCVAIDWDAKDAELKSGTIDCIWNGFTMNGREDDYTWSVPYYDNTIVVVVPSDSGVASLADLAGKTLMTQAGSSGLDALNSEDNAELLASLAGVVEEADYATGFMELEQGTVDGVVVDLGVAKFNIAGKEADYTILDEYVSSEQYGIGFYKGNTELCKQVEDTVKAMAEDGTMYEIAQNYADMGLTIESLCLCPENAK